MTDRELLTLTAALLRPHVQNHESAVTDAAILLRAVEHHLGALPPVPTIGFERPAPPQRGEPPAHNGGRKMPFGKHKGVPLDELARKEPDYLKWLRDNTELRQPLKGWIDDVLEGDPLA